MYNLPRLATVIAGVAAFASGVHAIQNVTRTGRYLYTADGNRFFIKGIAYQEQGAISTDPNNPFLEPSNFTDPLIDGAACSRDLPFLQQLGVNAIRVYSVNSSLNHDACMSTFSNAGIYTIIDLALPVNGSIDRASPAWTTNLLDLYLNTINVFSKYDNVLAYNVGNEVVIDPTGTGAAAFIKAAARDVKSYLKSISSSALVGYAAIDGDSTWVDPLANYLDCDPSGSNSGDTSIDLFGLNNYEWLQRCGVLQRVRLHYLPPRLWTEVQALFSSPMTDIWSGGLAFSYFPATSSQGQFGIVNISSDGSTVTTGDDFSRLKTQYSEVSPPNSPTLSSAGPNTFSACPQENSTFLASSTLPPTPNDAACSCLESELSCQFTPKTTNTSGIVGTLLDTACSLLGGTGGSCAAISANGTTGTYGSVAFCDPEVKLSFVMSEYYEATGRLATSCDFSGNATVNSGAPSSGATAAVTSCLANPSATAGSSGSSNNKNGAVGLLGNPQAWWGLASRASSASWAVC
ncbi:1,3-beta-glucanosyltransferase gel4 [Grifola frondosa]|uniref:1,3-beta-glucanosyltransferase n=1 Tax=Grifola frondosa TaxID=5627 RepID=A0A1C7MQF2_GRIFR|nr:1,3-beta-glucanosyltransferase gel4 [Grifola frondosa]